MENNIVERSKKLYWIATVLVNNEVATDAELESYFQREGHMNLEEVKFYLRQRSRAFREGLSFEVDEF